jgi:hypothetical protein
VLSGEQQDRTESLRHKVAGLLQGIPLGERLPRHREVLRKPAVAAGREALVGQIHRRVHAHGPTESGQRQSTRRRGQRLQQLPGLRRKKGSEVFERPIQRVCVHRAHHAGRARCLCHLQEVVHWQSGELVGERRMWGRLDEPVLLGQRESEVRKRLNSHGSLPRDRPGT